MFFKPAVAIECNKYIKDEKNYMKYQEIEI